MAKYTFSKISIFSIDEEEDDDGNVSPSLESLVLDSGLVSIVTTSLPSDLAMDASSLFLPREPLLLLESIRWQCKEKVIVEDEGGTYRLKENVGDDGIMGDTKTAKRGGVLTPSPRGIEWTPP
ncbi:hypothetical protein Fot_35264 [Forsythia ovata]|uniref:Uncharacterized protein n=1 Tax=Forsythia ovata TaxID=205694 RepID=A0ABD1SL23_9LAMI